MRESFETCATVSEEPMPISISLEETILGKL